MLVNPWEIGVELIYRPRYQPIKYCTYWPVLGSFVNWNIIQVSNKSTTYEYFDGVHKVVLDGISENMSSLVHNRKYGAVNTVDPTTTGYYVVKLISEPYTLQEGETVNKQFINSDRIIVNALYLTQ